MIYPVYKVNVVGIMVSESLRNLRLCFLLAAAASMVGRYVNISLSGSIELTPHKPFIIVYSSQFLVIGRPGTVDIYPGVNWAVTSSSKSLQGFRWVNIGGTIHVVDANLDREFVDTQGTAFELQEGEAKSIEREIIPPSRILETTLT